MAGSDESSLILRASVKAILVTLGLWALGLAAIFLLALSQIGLTFALVVCAFLLLFPGINFLSWWMFRFVIDDEVAERFNLAAGADVLVLLIVTLGETFKQSTVNLMAPLLLDPVQQIAEQVIIENEDLSVRAPLLAA